jgi:molybdate transport system substrate-binding protein
MMPRSWWWVLAGMIGVAMQTPAREIRVAAASDLQTILPELAVLFDREGAAHVNVSYGSSGAFFAQIRNGAPFDVFLSADIEYPRQLAAGGQADAATLYEYATGRLVLWTRRDSGIAVDRGLAALSDARVTRIAIANPAHAPYGRAAVAALKHERVYDAVQRKLVLGENISQAAQFVDSGAADVGLLALSQAVAAPLNARGAYYQIPPEAHPPIQQAAVVLNASHDKDAARRFLALLRRPDIKALLDRSGFVAPRS